MTKEQTHHIRRVMRMQQGDVIRVADNSGRVLLAEVEYHQEEAAARVVREVRDCSQTSVELILAQGMIRGRNGTSSCRKVQSWGGRKSFRLYPAAVL